MLWVSKSFVNDKQLFSICPGRKEETCFHYQGFKFLSLIRNNEKREMPELVNNLEAPWRKPDLKPQGQHCIR